MSYADDMMIYAVLPKPLLCPQMMESLKQYLTAIYSWYLKWHIRLNPKKPKSIVVSRSQTFTLSGAELEELKSLHNLHVTLDV